MSKNKGLIIYALKEEFVPISISNTHIDYVFSGIGKARASMVLTQSILELSPDFVLNIGTAGSIHHAVGDIVVCRRFIDRDLRPLVDNGVISEIDLSNRLLSEDAPINRILDRVNNITETCNTGDSFVTDIANIEGDVVDMESFAHAVVCEHFQMPYLSIKYVTDIIGENSIQHWEDKLKDSQNGFDHWFSNLNQ